MKREWFSEQQIAFIMHQAEEGVSVEDVCRKAGISVEREVRHELGQPGALLLQQLQPLHL